VKGNEEAMEITVKELERTDVIAVRGRLEHFTTAELTEALEASHQRGKYNLVLDMSGVEYMSSVGFRALLTVQRHNKRDHHGELILARLPDQIRQALELTGINDLFKIFDDLSAAVAYAASLPETRNHGN
jgi:anti-sigma B factor antagonist